MQFDFVILFAQPHFNNIQAKTLALGAHAEAYVCCTYFLLLYCTSYETPAGRTLTTSPPAEYATNHPVEKPCKHTCHPSTVWVYKHAQAMLYRAASAGLAALFCYTPTPQHIEGGTRKAGGMCGTSNYV